MRVETTLQRKPKPHQEAKRLMRLLARRRSHWPAEPMLRQLSPVQVEALQAYIAARETEHRRLALTTLFFMLWALVFGICMGDFKATLFIFMGEGVFFSLFLSAAKQYRYAVYALTQTDDLRVLPSLIHATRFTWGDHPEIIRAIGRLLEHVTEADAGLLNATMQARLWNMAIPGLGSGERFDEALALHTLHALALIGNRNSLRQMQQLGAYVYTYAIHQRLIWQAQELAPCMEARLQRQEVDGTLLRAANTPTSAPNTLLRPARVVTPESPEQLLRAGTLEHSETEANS